MNPRRHARSALLVLLVLPFPLAVTVGADMAAPSAERLGLVVGSLYGLPSAAARGTAAESSAPPEPVAAPEPAGVPARPGAPYQSGPSRHPGAPTAAGHRAGGQRPAPSAGVWVARSQVLRLAQGRAIPRAESVPAQGLRPAGVRLPSAGALGVGMQDGDVITEVAGVAVHSTAEIVSLVLQARQRRAPALSGRFWRGATPYALNVEIPYLATDAGPRLR